MPTTRWSSLGPNIDEVLGIESRPVSQLAAGNVPAIVIRQAFPAEECTSLVRHLVDQELMYETGDPRIEGKALDADRADRYTKQGLNPKTTMRRRIDIGSSLGNLGEDKEHFLRHSEQTHQLFDRLFHGRPNPIKTIYNCLQRLAPEKTVITAHEPDGLQYGPAIFRVHYGGYTYGPHFDSVRQRENRANYAVHKFSNQLAGVLCIQNSTLEGVTAQGIVHRQFWNTEVDPYIKENRFDDWVQTHHTEFAQIDLEPGDLYFFNTEMIHEVPGVPGEQPRIVLATFIGYSENESEMMVWS